MADSLYLHESDEPEIYLERRNSATGELEPATGLSSVTVSYSATEEGSEIHATLKKTMAERSASPGTYYAAIAGTDKAAHLTVGQTVYRRYHDGPTDIDATHPMLVVEVRTV